MTVRPNQACCTSSSGLKVHTALTASRSRLPTRLQRCSLSRPGSMSSLLSTKYTVVPLACASASSIEPCIGRGMFLIISQQQHEELRPRGKCWRAELSCLSNLPCIATRSPRGIETCETKWLTSAMWTPTSRHPLSSHLTLKASSTSVQPAGAWKELQLVSQLWLRARFRLSGKIQAFVLSQGERSTWRINAEDELFRTPEVSTTLDVFL